MLFLQLQQSCPESFIHEDVMRTSGGFKFVTWTFFFDTIQPQSDIVIESAVLWGAKYSGSSYKLEPATAETF